MSSDTRQPTSYEQIPYLSKPYRESHPANIAAVAALFGMTPAPVERCRVLELGCAAGGNLLPMAEALPDAHFLGVDSSERQIADAQDDLRELGFANVEFRRASITEIDESWGLFDYIIAHGVYSWVPPDVRAQVMRICSKNLAPAGVAYVSYNIYPGWHMRGVVRELMLYRGRKTDDPAERIAAGRAVVDLFAKALEGVNDPYGKLLQQEAAAVREAHDQYLFHDHISEHNHPVYFHEFATAAAAEGLQYLSEANPAALRLANPQTDRMIRSISSDVIEIEQYMDFARNRAFRQTLLCHSNVALSVRGRARAARGIAPLEHGHVGGTRVDLSPGVGVEFRHPSGLSMTVTGPLAKAAMHELVSKWPASVPFEELVARAIEKIPAAPADRAAGILGNDLLRICGAGGLEISAAPTLCVATAPDRPVASRIARLDAKRQRPLVTSARHTQVELPEGARRILQMLDGRRDAATLARDAASQGVDRRPVQAAGAGGAFNWMNHSTGAVVE